MEKEKPEGMGLRVRHRIGIRKAGNGDLKGIKEEGQSIQQEEW